MPLPLCSMASRRAVTSGRAVWTRPGGVSQGLFATPGLSTYATATSASIAPAADAERAMALIAATSRTPLTGRMAQAGRKVPQPVPTPLPAISTGGESPSRTWTPQSKRCGRRFALSLGGLLDLDGLTPHPPPASRPARPSPPHIPTTGTLALKKGMATIWDEWGVQTPVTVLAIADNTVVRTRWDEQAGSYMTEIGAIAIYGGKIHRLALQQLQHFRRWGAEAKRRLVEFKVSPDAIIPDGGWDSGDCASVPPRCDSFVT